MALTESCLWGSFQRARLLLYAALALRRRVGFRRRASIAPTGLTRRGLSVLNSSGGVARRSRVVGSRGSGRCAVVPVGCSMNIAAYSYVAEWETSA